MLIDHNAKRYLDLCALSERDNARSGNFSAAVTFSSRCRAPCFLFFSSSLLSSFCRLKDQIKSRRLVMPREARNEHWLVCKHGNELNTRYVHIFPRRRFLRAGNYYTFVYRVTNPLRVNISRAREKRRERRKDPLHHRCAKTMHHL